QRLQVRLQLLRQRAATEPAALDEEPGPGSRPGPARVRIRAAAARRRLAGGRRRRGGGALQRAGALDRGAFSELVRLGRRPAPRARHDQARRGLRRPRAAPVRSARWTRHRSAPPRHPVCVRGTRERTRRRWPRAHSRGRRDRDPVPAARDRDCEGAMTVHRVRPARVYRFYRGGAMIDRLRGEPERDGEFPEDWVASVTAARNPGRDEPEAGLARLEDGRLLRDALAEDPTYWG